MRKPKSVSTPLISNERCLTFLILTSVKFLLSESRVQALRALHTGRDALDKTSEELRREISTKEEKVANLLQEREALSERIDVLLAAISERHDVIRENTEMNAVYREEVQELRNEQSGLRGELADLQRDCLSLRKKIREKGKI